MEKSEIMNMFYDAPVLLHALVRKCHNVGCEVPTAIMEMLERRELIKDGMVPEDVRQFVLQNIQLTEGGGISIRS